MSTLASTSIPETRFTLSEDADALSLRETRGRLERTSVHCDSKELLVQRPRVSPLDGAEGGDSHVRGLLRRGEAALPSQRQKRLGD